MTSAHHRGTGVFSRSVYGKLSLDFREALEGESGVDGLRQVGQRPRLGHYLSDLWGRRLFVYAGAIGQASTQYSRDRLGSLWLVIRPILDAIFYYVVFALLLQVDRGMENFIAWLLIGLFMFQFSSRCISSSAGLIRSSKPMIRAFAFPRASLAISLIAREALLSMPAFGTMLVLIMSIPPHAFPTWAWLSVLALFPLQVLLTLGLVLLFARVGATLPDFARVMSFITRVLTYASGVIIPVERFIRNDVIGAIIYGNPFYVLLNMYRSAWMDGVMPALGDWLYIGGWAVATFLIGFIAFWWAEEKYGQE